VGRAYYEHLAVTHAANVAARWATLTGTEQYCTGYADVQQVVAEELSSLPITVHNPPTVVVGTTADAAPAVTVSITYDHRFLFGSGGTWTLKAGSMMPGTYSTPVVCSCCPTPVLPPPPPTPTVTPTFTNTPTNTPT